MNNPDSCYRGLWNWVTDFRDLRCAWRKIAGNKGSRTAGIEGMTVGRIRDSQGSEVFLKKLRNDLRAGRIDRVPADGSGFRSRASRGNLRNSFASQSENNTDQASPCRLQPRLWTAYQLSTLIAL